MDASTSSVEETGLFSQVFEDIDEQAACLAGHDQHYQQLSRGRFEGRFSTALLGLGLDVYFEKINQVLDQWGAIPEAHYSAIFVMNRDARCKLNGSTFSADDVFLGGPGAEFHTLGQPGTHFCVISATEDYLKEFEALDRQDRKPIRMRHRSYARSLQQLARNACSIFENGPGDPASGFLSGLSASIAEVMLDGAYASEQTPDYGGPDSHLRTVRHARAFIEAHADEDIRVANLCRHVGVSRRALEYSFQVCLEQSPAAYLRSVRLNEIRRALRAPENAGRPIGDIAAQWGIWHLSRFAQYYQAQFGELPSQTRALVG